MKILFLIESMASESGGTAIEIARLSDKMAEELGINITIACNTPRNKCLPINKKINYFQFEAPSFPGLSWLKAVRNLRKLISQHDLVFSTGIWGPIDGFALRLSWPDKKPVYLRVCGMLEPYILKRNPLKKSIGKLLYLRKNINRASGIIVNSIRESQTVFKAGVPKNKIILIPNGIHIQTRAILKLTAKQYLGIDPNCRVLLYLGRIHPKKGLHLLLKAIAAAQFSGKKFFLLVAGEFSNDSYRSEIEEIIHSNGLKKMVIFSGLVTGEEKERHFSAADCFILPSQSEGLPNAVLEALSYGVPAIVTSGCNMPEISEYNAGMEIELTDTNLQNAIRWFLSDKTNLDEASFQAIQLIRERFSPEVTLNKYLSLIKAAS